MAMRNQGNRRFKPYNKGDQVWVEGTNIKTLYPSAKLSPKRYGPFKVLEQLSEAVYRLEIPRHWKIHNVFHANLITPYKETELHGPNFTRPPPDLIEGEQEFEVKKILDVQPRGQGRKMHFLVKWKGYPMSDNSWEPRENLHVDRLIAEYNKKKQRQAEPKKKGVKSRRARTEEKSPSSPINHHLSSSHRNIISAHSAPIVSSSTPSTPVTHTSMLPSPPREAASPSLISPIAPVVLTTAMKEEDVPDNSNIMNPEGFPEATNGVLEPKNSFKAYVSDDPEHVDDCRNCGLPHDTRPALDSQHWPLVLVELLE